MKIYSQRAKLALNKYVFILIEYIICCPNKLHKKCSLFIFYEISSVRKSELIHSPIINFHWNS